MTTSRVCLGDLCDFPGGGTPSKKIPRYYDGEIPWVTVKDFKAPLIKDTMAINQDVKAVIPHTSELDPDFLLWTLTVCAPTLEAMATGATVKGVTLDQVKALPVLLPTLPEQRRIVDILNRADAIRRLRREAIAKARELIPALFVDMFGDPLAAGGPFPHGPLRDVVTVLSGATPSKKEPRFWGGDISWVSAKDMKVDQISTSQDHVTNAALTETNLKLVPENSILIVVRGMILIHTVPIALNVRPLTINQDLKALLPGDNVKSTYLHWALKCSHSELLARVSTAAHGTRKLDTDRLMSLQVPVPPIELQDEFSRRAEDLISVANNQERMAEQADTLMASLMHQLFNGEANESLAAELEAAAS